MFYASMIDWRRFFGLVVCLLLLTACGSEPKSQLMRKGGGSSQQRVSGELFDNALSNFNQLENYSSDEILEQSYQRLNDWASGKQPKVDWQRDEILATLPEKFSDAVSSEKLSEMRFDWEDAEYLRRCVWMRDVSEHVAGGSTGGLGAAERLFDWVFRNIQIDPDPSLDTLRPINYLPDESLLFGHGRVIDKSWIFVLLAQQQHLDAVLLAVPDAGQPSGYRVWLPAIFEDGEFYLFDMALGLPIPGPGGEGIATLAQVREQPELLQPMATEEFPYRLKPDDLETVTALVVADEQALSKRMLAVESHLAGDERLLLTVPTEELVDRLKQSDQVSGVLLWQRPFAIAAERIAPIPPASQQAVAEQMRPFEFNVPGRAVNPLWAGRLLQFRGEFDGKEGARAELLAAREAIQIASQLPDPNQFTAEQIQVILAARLIATDWLAHISFETEQYDNAVEFFGPRLMMAFRSIRPTESNAMYEELLRSIQASARYNYGRSFEAAEQIPEAVFNYAVDHSPNRPASLLRRQRLMASLSEDERAELDRQVEQLRQQMEALQSGGDQPGGE